MLSPMSSPAPQRRARPVRLLLTMLFTSLKRFLPAHLRNAIWPELPAPGKTDCKASTTHEVFEAGFQRSPTRNCLGIRPRVVADPKAPASAPNEVKYADHYVWETYEQVNKRKLDLGSAIEGLFRSGKAGGGELPTVGIWSINRPGTCFFGRFWTLLIPFSM